MKKNIFPKGFHACGIHCGIKKNGKNDLSIFYSATPCTAAGVFTKNLVKAAPVIVSKKNIKNKISAIIANSGCANACTGKRGIKDAEEMCAITAKMLNVKPLNILVASTGVIGQFLPMNKIKNGIKNIFSELSNYQIIKFDNSIILKSPTRKLVLSAVEGIMTTDTFVKVQSSEFGIRGSKATIWGCCKGAGMIHPDMATMLCFVLTDVSISKKLLAEALKSAVDKSFNRISVDGDTSTNDCVFLLANGAAGNKPIIKKDDSFFAFALQLEKICLGLAKKIVSDGEGATKIIVVAVKNAASESDARKIAATVATSPLVKTAMFGNDANWGRIIAAAGRSGAKINPSKMDIYFGGMLVAKNGAGTNFSEKKAKEILNKKEVTVTLDLKSGHKCFTYYASDLTFDYVKINASYRS